MKITLNPNEELVQTVKAGLEKTEENKCMCREFREQIEDENFEGYCHCMLYYKSND